MQEVQFTVSQRAIRSVFAGANGRYSHCRKMGVPVCRRASPFVTKRHRAPPMQKSHLGRESGAPREVYDGILYEKDPRAPRWRASRDFGRDPAREGPSGAKMTPEGPFLQRLHAEKRHTVTQLGRRPSAQATSGARAADPWAHGSSGTAGSPRTRRKPPTH